jgi:hypothetical protein
MQNVISLSEFLLTRDKAVLRRRMDRCQLAAAARTAGCTLRLSCGGCNCLEKRACHLLMQLELFSNC